MRRFRIVEALLTVSVSSLALSWAISHGRAEVQGLDDLYSSRGGRSACSGGYVDGLGCRDQNPVGPGIQDSDQGWQRDWQDFQSAGPGYGYGNWGYGGWGYGGAVDGGPGNGGGPGDRGIARSGGPMPSPRNYAPPPPRNYGGDNFDEPPRGLGRPYWPPTERR
jgi:hypothetical protein